ncbi:hypothetical protein LXA15_17480, partial [Erwinia amylovora]|uniref:hypothetical protein n=1 Tax=Erwinia amylovora TaxID=552 RepID=UPI0020C0968E
GSYDIVPGVFLPSKSWDQIVADSERVKQNLPADRSNWQCGRVLILKNNKAFCGIGGGGSVSSYGYSFMLPSNNRVVLSTAAQWVSTYGDPSD